MSTPDWIVGRPSDNKDFIGAIVVASLLVTSFFAGTGVMLYFWIKAWQGEDMHGKQMSYRGEKETDLIDLEAGKVIPEDGSDEPSIVEASKWHHETITIDVDSLASESSSARTSSDAPSNGLTPTSPRPRDLHESYPNQ